MTGTNRYVTFGSYIPEGILPPDALRLDAGPMPRIGAGEVLLHPVAISVDPFQRNLLSGRPHHALANHVPGKPISGFAVAQVVKTRNDDYQEGTLVYGWMDWADYAVWPNGNKRSRLQRLKDTGDRPSLTLTIFGSTGLTAYFGIVEVGQVRKDEVIVISSAAGAVGSIAGQIARIAGARTIGLTSSQEKRDILTERLGFDVALDYRAEDFVDQLRHAAPGGPDIYLDHVGGELTTRIMREMRRPARVIELGQIANYSDLGKAWTVDTDPIHANGLRYEGYHPGLFPDQWAEALARLRGWVAEGKITPLETVLEGLQSMPQAMHDLFTGRNVGKVVVTAEPL